MSAGRKKEPSACQSFKQLESAHSWPVWTPRPNSLYFGLTRFDRKSTGLAETFYSPALYFPFPHFVYPTGTCYANIQRGRTQRVQRVFQESSLYPNLIDLETDLSPPCYAHPPLPPQVPQISSGGMLRDTEPLAPTQEGGPTQGTRERTRPGNSRKN